MVYLNFDNYNIIIHEDMIDHHHHHVHNYIIIITTTVILTLSFMIHTKLLQLLHQCSITDCVFHPVHISLVLNSCVADITLARFSWNSGHLSDVLLSS